MTKKKTTTADARIPRSRATTRMGLLDDVVTAVREAPRRLYMPLWLKRYFARGERRPACGTAACVAGWVVILHDGVRAATRLNKDDEISNRAMDLLGIDYKTAWQGLFSGDVFDPDTNEPVKPGTKRYVDLVVERIHKFMGKHEDLLQRPIDVD